MLNFLPASSDRNCRIMKNLIFFLFFCLTFPELECIFYPSENKYPKNLYTTKGGILAKQNELDKLYCRQQW